MTTTAMQTMSRLAFDWGVRCFGMPQMRNLRLRSFRAAEEVIELAQACDAPRDMMHKLVDQVYDRPKGDRIQELGGSFVTLCVLCEMLGITPEDAFERELTRVLSKSAESFATRNRNKMNLEPLKS